VDDCKPLGRTLSMRGSVSVANTAGRNGENTSAARVWWRNLNLQAKFESGSSYCTFKR